MNAIGANMLWAEVGNTVVSQITPPYNHNDGGFTKSPARNWWFYSLEYTPYKAFNQPDPRGVVLRAPAMRDDNRMNGPNIEQQNGRPTAPDIAASGHEAQRNLATVLVNDANTIVTGVLTGVATVVATAKVLGDRLGNKGAVVSRPTLPRSSWR